MRRFAAPALGLWLALALCGGVGAAHADEAPPAAVWLLADAVRQSGDALTSAAHGQGAATSGHFAVVDKAGARVWVFSPQGKPIASSPVLVGQATGDVAPADIGQRPLSRIRPHEKITPAGRFVSEEGANLAGEDVVWLDYDGGLSMHRVRNVAGERRHERVASPRLADRRISYGCINVPASFYDEHIRPLFGRRQSVVYVLPEQRPASEVFDFMGNGAAAR